MKKLLIVHRAQFGYHIDTYMWCKYLISEYDIKLVCFDFMKPRMAIEGVDVKYVSNRGNTLIRGIRYIVIALFEIARFNGIIIVSSFPECGIFKKILPFKRMVLDIRSFSVEKSECLRKKTDSKIIENAKLYDYVITISEGLRARIKKSSKLTAVMPLGGEIIADAPKSFKDIRLLYVGTFANRDLHKTIEGLALAKKKIDNSVSIEYNIIGRGFGEEENQMRALCESYGLSSIVHFCGYVPHNQLMKYFEECNIGISFVPITDYYDYQPPTKTFEYGLSGLFTIATDTYANREVLNEVNGILIKDTAEAFSEALVYILKHKESFNSESIRETMTAYTWGNLIENRLKPILIDICNKIYY